MSTPPSAPLRVALIGCGRQQTTATGFGMAHRHTAGCRASGRCTLVAVANLSRHHAELGCLLRIVGEHGTIEILFDTPWLRLLRAGQTAGETADTGEKIHDDQALYRGIADLLAGLDAGALPQLGANAPSAPPGSFSRRTSRRAGAVAPICRRHPDPCAMLSKLARGELTTDW